jgi:hypothetical protein
MRWDNLFDDLEGQLEHELTVEELDLRAEEERLRLGRLSLRDRIQAVHELPKDADRALRVTLTDGSIIAVEPHTLGRDWFSADVVDDAQRQSQCIIPLPAIAAIAFSKPQLVASLVERTAETAPGTLASRLTLSFVLRDLCRRRVALELVTSLGRLHGTIDRVGRDHLDVAVHEQGEARRDSAVTQWRLVPLTHVVLVRL